MLENHIFFCQSFIVNLIPLKSGNRPNYLNTQLITKIGLDYKLSYCLTNQQQDIYIQI